MAQNIKKITFTNYLASVERISYLPLLETSESIINKSIIDDVLTITYDVDKLKAYANKTKKMSSYNYTDILAGQYANNIIELSVDN